MSSSASSAIARRQPAPSPALFYLDGCPRCGAPLRTPFSRYGGPQYSEHFCGAHYEPRKARFLVAASGTGYMAVEVAPGERVEPVFERWVGRWRATGLDAERRGA